MINDFLKFGYAAILTVIVIALAVDLVWGLAAGLAVALLGLLGLFLLHLPQGIYRTQEDGEESSEVGRKRAPLSLHAE